jgi:hypothetical protein
MAKMVQSTYWFQVSTVVCKWDLGSSAILRSVDFTDLSAHPHIQKSSSPRTVFLNCLILKDGTPRDASTLKMGPMDCSETWLTNYSTLLKIPHREQIFDPHILEKPDNTSSQRDALSTAICDEQIVLVLHYTQSYTMN